MHMQTQCHMKYKEKVMAEKWSMYLALKWTVKKKKKGGGHIPLLTQENTLFFVDNTNTWTLWLNIITTGTLRLVSNIKRA